MANVILSHLVCFSGAPDIIITDKDPRFTGAEFLQFRRDRAIDLQAVNPGHRQSLGSTEREYVF